MTSVCVTPGEYEGLGVTLVGKWIEPLVSLESPVPLRVACNSTRLTRHSQDLWHSYGTSVSAETHKFWKVLKQAGT